MSDSPAKSVSLRAPSSGWLIAIFAGMLVTALWLLGMFLVISIPYIGIWLGYFLYGDWGMWTYLFGLMFSLGVGSILGILVLIIQESGQDIQIRVVEQR